MLYRFKSKAGADVVMLADSGEAVLRLLGREPAPQGILEVAALPGQQQPDRQRTGLCGGYDCHRPMLPYSPAG